MFNGTLEELIKKLHEVGYGPFRLELVAFNKKRLVGKRIAFKGENQWDEVSLLDYSGDGYSAEEVLSVVSEVAQ